MMLEKQLRKFLNGGAAVAGPEGLEREIDGIEKEKTEFQAELARLPSLRSEAILADSYDEQVKKLEAREEELYRALEKCDRQIALLTEKIAEQRNIRRGDRIEFHRKALAAARAGLAEKVTAALISNETAIAAWAAASAELGEADASQLFQRIHYGGVVNRECFEIWQRDFAPRAPQPAISPIAAIPRRPSAPAVAAVSPRWPVVPKRARDPLPEKTPEGKRRVIVLRDGYEVDGQRYTVGEPAFVDLKIADAAAKAGAIEFMKPEGA